MKDECRWNADENADENQTTNLLLTNGDGQLLLDTLKDIKSRKLYDEKLHLTVTHVASSHFLI